MLLFLRSTTSVLAVVGTEHGRPGHSFALGGELNRASQWKAACIFRKFPRSAAGSQCYSNARERGHDQGTRARQRLFLVVSRCHTAVAWHLGWHEYNLYAAWDPQRRRLDCRQFHRKEYCWPLVSGSTLWLEFREDFAELYLGALWVRQVSQLRGDRVCFLELRSRFPLFAILLKCQAKVVVRFRIARL